MNLKIIIHIIRKEFLQFRRDPKMFGIILLAPVIQLIFLGYAATLDVNTVHTVVYDQDKTLESRDFINEFASSGFFEMTYSESGYKDIQKSLDGGNTILAIIIPKDFGKKIVRRETAQVQAIFNGSDGNTASIAAGYVIKIVQKYSADKIALNMEMSGRKFVPVGRMEAEVRVWYNPYLKTRYFMVPAIVGLLLSIITLILTSLAIVKEKEIGTLEQLIVTPIKPFQLLVGKLIPFAILGFISVIIVLTAMRLIFGIPVRGNIFFLFFSSLLYILSTLGLGLFVSTISKTQQQAMMIAVFAIMMPMVFLSGFAFPIENMPDSIQLLSYAIPLRYFITIIRGVILKGLGFTELWVESIILFSMGVVILFLSSLRFKKTLE